MEKMRKLWAAVTTFNILFILNLWWMDRTGNAVIDVFTPDDRWESVPIFGLTLGSLFTIISFHLLLSYVRKMRSEGRPWHGRIPTIWIQPDELVGSFRRAWLVFIIVVCIVLPIAAQVQFWYRLDNWQVWKNYDPGRGERVQLLQPISPKFLLDWDAHRYGDYSKRAERKGVSFVPLFQPLLMFGLSIAVMLIAGAIFTNLIRKPKKQHHLATAINSENSS